MLIAVPVAGILQGDRFQGYWRAYENAQEHSDGSVTVVVQYTDGGLSTRKWYNGDQELEIEREVKSNG